MRAPLLHELRLDGRDLLDHAVHVATPVFSGLPLDLFDHLPEHQLGVAYRPEVDLIVLVDVLDGVGDLRQRHVLRHRRVEMRIREARADSQHEVRLLQVVMHHQRAGVGSRSKRKRVAFGEGTLARQRRHHGNVSKLGELDELLVRLRVVNALPDVHHRSAGLQKLGNDFAYHVGVGR